MSSQPEQDPKAFSPRFEQAVQRQERIEARRNPPPRQRVRTKPCEMDGCEASVYRNNTFSICLNHMLLIWKHVEASGEAIHDVGEFIEYFPKPTVEIKPATDEELEMREMAKRQKARDLASAKGDLYVLDTQSGLLKIGWSSRLEQRLAQYPPTFTVIATCPGTRTDERDVHRSLRLARAMGREWYYVTPEVVRQVNQMISTNNVGRARRHSDHMAGMQDESDRRHIGNALSPAFEPAEHHITSAPTKAAPIRPTKTAGRRVG